jgi:hypothetical protein
MSRIQFETKLITRIENFYFFNKRTQYHVIEQSRVLPTFSMYSRVDENQVEKPKSYVTFLVNERVQRVLFFVSLSFFCLIEYFILKLFNLDCNMDQ